ncbi:hypothetical protein C8F01DRAFT_1265463 [Mycena amicta]|nr:hypothetical protein C8F01DRAFT_1265463 [Mycena amicta]
MAVGPLPSFHAIGFFVRFLSPIFNGVVACIYPPASLSAQSEHRVPTKTAQATGMLTVPMFLTSWAPKEEDVRYLSSLNLVDYWKLFYLEGDSAREDLGLSKDVFAEATQENGNGHHTLRVGAGLQRIAVYFRASHPWDAQSHRPRPLLQRTRTVPVHLFHRDQSKGPLPEELQLDAGVAVGNGYGESEYVFERIFAA